MPLLRSGSAKSTLSMMNRRATQYQKYLTLASVFLIIFSTIVIFTAIILIKFYFLEYLDFWSLYFKVVPVFMITLGVYKFCVAGYGFSISNTENRALLIVFAVLLGIAFIAQLGSIFTAIEVRTLLVLSNVGGANVVESLRQYNIDPTVTNQWDQMQQQLRCCGGTNWLTGYSDYTNAPIGERNQSVPDSCCHSMTKDCGRGIFELSSQQIRQKIFVDGCLTVLKGRLDDDVVPMMAVYAGVGVAIALLELIAVALTAAYVAQITRRRHREEKMWNATRGGRDDNDGQEMGRLTGGPTVEHETVC